MGWAASHSANSASRDSGRHSRRRTNATELGTVARVAVLDDTCASTSSPSAVHTSTASRHVGEVGRINPWKCDHAAFIALVGWVVVISTTTLSIA